MTQRDSVPFYMCSKNLVLKHSVHHTPPNDRDITWWIVELKPNFNSFNSFKPGTVDLTILILRNIMTKYNKSSFKQKWDLTMTHIHIANSFTRTKSELKNENESSLHNFISVVHRSFMVLERDGYIGNISAKWRNAYARGRCPQGDPDLGLRS